MGMFDSQAGNIMFPTWEHLVPLMGILSQLNSKDAAPTILFYVRMVTRRHRLYPFPI